MELQQIFIQEHITNLADGPITDVKSQCEFMRQLIVSNKIQTVLEIGFGSGFSSCFFLDCGCDVDSVDIHHDAAMDVAKDFIDRKYPGKHILIEGHSTLVLSYLNKQYDLIFIDGSNTLDIRKSDVHLSKRLSKKSTIIIMDDVVKEQSTTRCWNIDPTDAWNQSIQDGIIIEQGYKCFENGRGIAWGNFTQK